MLPSRSALWGMPSSNEVMEADRLAWSEALRLHSEGEGSIEACLTHVAKPGGFVAGVLKPAARAAEWPQKKEGWQPGGAWKKEEPKDCPLMTHCVRGSAWWRAC